MTNSDIEKIRLQQTTEILQVLGMGLGIISKHLLESTGVVVNYKINGEDISDLEKLHELNIVDKIKLAVAEERYEDAANLKKLLDKKNVPDKR